MVRKAIDNEDSTESEHSEDENNADTTTIVEDAKEIRRGDEPSKSPSSREGPSLDAHDDVDGEDDTLLDNPLVDLTAFQRDLLTVIARGGDPIGLDVKERLEDSGYGEINHGRIYPALDELARTGLIQKESEGRSNTYRLARRGKRELAIFCEWVDHHCEFHEDDDD